MAGFRQFYEDYVAGVTKLLADVDVVALESFAAVLSAAASDHGAVAVFGNGGSAATALHMVNDLGNAELGADVPGIRPVALPGNVAWLTALANDHGYDDVFARQVQRMLKRGDVAVAINVSGNSENVVRGLAAARERGAHTLGLLGSDGGRCASLCDVPVIVPTREFGPAEDVHLMLEHLVCEWLKSAGRFA